MKHHILIIIIFVLACDSAENEIIIPQPEYLLSNIYDSAGNLVAHYEYDDQFRLKRTYFYSHNILFFKNILFYENNFLKSVRSILFRNGNVDGVLNVQYVYDSIGRLVYIKDGYQNLINIVSITHNNIDEKGIYTYKYNRDHKIDSVFYIWYMKSFEYDGNGNILNSDSYTFFNESSGLVTRYYKTYFEYTNLKKDVFNSGNVVFFSLYPKYYNNFFHEEINLSKNMIKRIYSVSEEGKELINDEYFYEYNNYGYVLVMRVKSKYTRDKVFYFEYK